MIDPDHHLFQFTAYISGVTHPRVLCPSILIDVTSLWGLLTTNSISFLVPYTQFVDK